MKHLFIRHIVTGQAYSDATPSERKKWFEEFAKAANEYGLKLIFWGTPWGVPESLTVVFESNRSLDNFVGFGTVWGERLKQLGLKSYGVSATTVTVTAPE